VARHLSEIITSTSYVELPQVGHLPWLERPNLLRGVLRGFLEDLS
jgi:pimeloyl-ACP methyl ester carboxylesterase